MALADSDAVALVADDLLGKWRRERDRLDRIDAWARWDHDKPSKPRAKSNTEYAELSKRAQSPWGALIVTSVAQTLYVDGYRRPSAQDDVAAWRLWQANQLDKYQSGIHRAALTYGISYGLVLPGELNGESIPQMRGVSPREMIAVYEDPAFDEWPEYAMRVRPKGDGFQVSLYDDTTEYRMVISGLGAKPEFKERLEHGAGVTPVVRYENLVDLEGRVVGEVEPVIPLLGKIDQTSFDRLVVQRFASWIVRTIAGMNKPDSQADADAEKLRLKVEDILVSVSSETRFGSLPASPLSPFIEAHDSDVKALSALTQTPAHEMLGQMANLSAEALEAAKASQRAKSDERKQSFGESHEQFLRLASHVSGDSEGASDFTAQVTWRDTSVRSLAQATDALGKLAQMLGVPFEILWEKIPGFTQFDVERAKTLLEQGDSLAALMRELAGGQISPAVDAPVGSTEDADAIKAKADAMGVLIRSGVDPESAAARVGLSGVRFTGAVPVSLRLPESDASRLETA